MYEAIQLDAARPACRYLPEKSIGAATQPTAPSSTRGIPIGMGWPAGWRDGGMTQQPQQTQASKAGTTCSRVPLKMFGPRKSGDYPSPRLARRVRASAHTLNCRSLTRVCFRMPVTSSNWPPCGRAYSPVASNRRSRAFANRLRRTMKPRMTEREHGVQGGGGVLSLGDGCAPITPNMIPT